MELWESLRKLFSFSKKERMGFLILLIAIAVVVALPFFKTPLPTTHVTAADSSWLDLANNLQPSASFQESARSNNNEDVAASYQHETSISNLDNKPPSEGALFVFDPNTLREEGFKKLGLRDRTIQILMNYRSKGGTFKKPDDLAKIYGLRQHEFERLRPYIRIAPPPTIHTSATSSAAPYPQNQAPPAAAPPRYTPKMIEINAATAADYEALYGIGNKLAARIINFRDKLGGFYSIDQVGETFGVPDSTFQKIKPQLQVNATLIKKININTADYNELNIHPYINGKTAFELLKYRKEEGLFSSIKDIAPLIRPNDSYEKIAPYIKVE